MKNNMKFDWLFNKLCYNYINNEEEDKTNFKQSDVEMVQATNKFSYYLGVGVLKLHPVNYRYLIIKR